jgi:hypothetical protein
MEQRGPWGSGAGIPGGRASTGAARDRVVDGASRVPGPPRAARCVFCGTPLRLRADAGWRHDVRLHDRGGCCIPCPEPTPSR